MNEFKRLKKLLSENLLLDEKALSPELTLEDLGMDSLTLLELVIAVEEEFGITIYDDEMSEIKTLGELADLVMVKLNE